MRRVLAVLALFALSPSIVWAAAERYALPAQFWLNARSGQSVAAEPALARAVQRFVERPRALLIIHHSREDESLAQAEELRGWLIALGVEAGRVSLREASPLASATERILTIEVTDNK